MSVCAATTESTDTTETTEVAGYTAENEAQFVDGCVKNPQNTRLFCRCVFKGVKEKITFQRFLEIDALVQNGGSLKDTEVQPIIEDCTKRNPTN
jgi:hypothetical protein